jgi:hypothetical protein
MEYKAKGSDDNMTFNVCFLRENAEGNQEEIRVGEMTIADFKEFIAMLEETPLNEGIYSGHWFDVDDKTFYIEVA